MYLTKLLKLYKKGPLHSIPHFTKNAENTRITGMIDFVLEQRYKDMIS